MRIRYAAFIALFLPVSLSAQVEEAENPSTTTKWEAEVAPEWATGTPLSLSDTTDATTVSLRIKVTHEFSDAWSLDLEAGPSTRLDSDGDDAQGAGSSFGASAEMNLAASERFKFYGGVGYKAKFEDFFDDDKPDETNYTGGIKYEKPLLYIDGKPSTTFKARAFYTLTDSTSDAKDLEKAQIRFDWANPIKSWGLFGLQGTFSRRWFQNQDVDAGYKERTDDLGLSAGIDFQPIARRFFRDDSENPLIQRVRLGVGYFERDSNIDINDDDGTFTPVVSIVIGRKF